MTRSVCAVLKANGQHMNLHLLFSQVTEAELLCQQQSFHEALGLATQCVNRIEEEHGKESLRLIDPYIVIGLANAGCESLNLTRCAPSTLPLSSNALRLTAVVVAPRECLFLLRAYVFNNALI